MAAKPVRKPRRKISVPKNCYYCIEKKEPSFWEQGSLQRFVTERGKIIPRSRNGLCAKHQDAIEASIKYARLLALMPFISK
ncbi:MAG: 30S ribosomal protein S18 [Patescibacteria group bacterium]